jgi:hypothetical protein
VEGHPTAENPAKSSEFFSPGDGKHHQRSVFYDKLMATFLLSVQSMARARDTVRHLMFSYPALYPSAFKAAEELLTGSSWEWQKGELISREPLSPLPTAMDFNDLNERKKKQEASIQEWKETPGLWESLSSLAQTRTLDLAFETLQRQFVADHIEALLDAGLDHEFRREGKSVLARDGLATHFFEQAPAFHIPPDIAPDWAKLAQNFNQEWQRMLLMKHGADRALGDVSAWSADGQAIFHAVEAAQKVLYPILNGGESHADGLARRAALSKRLIAEMTADNEAERKITKRSARPGR